MINRPDIYVLYSTFHTPVIQFHFSQQPNIQYQCLSCAEDIISFSEHLQTVSAALKYCVKTLRDVLCPARVPQPSHSDAGLSLWGIKLDYFLLLSTFSVLDFVGLLFLFQCTFKV